MAFQKILKLQGVPSLILPFWEELCKKIIYFIRFTYFYKVYLYSQKQLHMEVHLMSQSPVEPLPGPEGIYQAKEGDWDKLIASASNQLKTKMLKMFEVKSKQMANKVKKRRVQRKLNKKFTK